MTFGPHPGGSGFVGRALCEQLDPPGPRPRLTVPTRRPPHAQGVQSLPGVTVLQADVFRDLPALLPGHDAVVNLIAILQGSEPPSSRCMWSCRAAWPRPGGPACAAWCM
jgi:uncharacterized protein YbjT (DUF2867 family)